MKHLILADVRVPLKGAANPHFSRYQPFDLGNKSLLGLSFVMLFFTPEQTKFKYIAHCNVTQR